MKVYAIKREDGKYLKVTIDPYNDFNEEEFVNDLYEATLYASYDLEYAEYKCEDLRGCQVVECELMEANELADHDKKVRAEVVAEIKSALREKVVKMQGNTHCYPENAICWEDVVAVLNRVLRGEE